MYRTNASLLSADIFAVGLEVGCGGNENSGAVAAVGGECRGALEQGFEVSRDSPTAVGCVLP